MFLYAIVFIIFISFFLVTIPCATSRLLWVNIIGYPQHQDSHGGWLWSFKGPGQVGAHKLGGWLMAIICLGGSELGLTHGLSLLGWP